MRVRVCVRAHVLRALRACLCGTCKIERVCVVCVCARVACVRVQYIYIYIYIYICVCVCVINQGLFRSSDPQAFSLAIRISLQCDLDIFTVCLCVRVHACVHACTCATSCRRILVFNASRLASLTPSNAA